MKILVKRIIKIMIVLFIVGSIASVGVVLGVINKYSKELPDIVTLIEDYAPSLPTVLYDRNGEVIDTIYRESRDTVKLKEVPIYSRNAFLAIEDKQFYSHHGIHMKRLIGAIVANIRSGRAVQGASSITQQLAKNAFLSHERKLSRKIKEAIITFEIERRYTLNEIYFGAGSYGIKTAAKQLYRKDISEINIAESALLAGIPNRPEKYNPRRNLEASLKRANLILSEMYKDKLITKEEYEQAKNRKFINEDKLPEDFKMDDNTTIIYNKKSDVNILLDALDGKLGSSTRQPNRGRGMPQLKHMVEKNWISNFALTTNTVSLRYIDNEFVPMQHSNFVGTYYSWTINKENYLIWKQRSI